MRKIAKAISALAFAVVMSLSFGAVAFADEYTGLDIAEGNGSTSFEVTFTPAEGLSLPVKTFEYSIAAAAGDDTASPEVFAGVEGISITESVAFTANDTDTSKTVTVTFPQASAFTHAGIYRYEVTQKYFSADEVDAGILNEKGNGRSIVKVLELYVNKDGVVTGAAMKFHDGTTKSSEFANTFGVAPTDPADPDNPLDPDDPDNPYDPTNPDDPSDPTDPDNPSDPDGPGTPANAAKHVITLSKTVTGAMGDTSELFPFELAITSTNTVLAGVNYTVSSDTTNTWTIGTTYSDRIQLKGGDSITITVPNDVNVAVKELTPSTEGYKITSAGTGFTGDVTVVSAVAEDTGFAGALDSAEETATVAYTNDRDEISPTGVALRFAPYLFMLAAGVAVLMVSRRRKADMLD